jgi:hypothetical protein
MAKALLVLPGIGSALMLALHVQERRHRQLS